MYIRYYQNLRTKEAIEVHSPRDRRLNNGDAWLELQDWEYEAIRKDNTAARLAAAEELAEALTDILPDSDVDGETDCCMWCGREFDKGEYLCASDDCAGHKARAALAEWKQTK